ncbi:hypothetical protein ACFYU5_02110 [Nocardia aobensis]|uniref:Uncharacterized protein n=1 Tax=Nocardia aobensis TaxID=257277 RepID=A0ABW6NVM3_9NOCA
MAGGCASDGAVGRADFVCGGGAVVFGAIVVVDRVAGVVGDPDVVTTSGDGDGVALVALVVVVVGVDTVVGWPGVPVRAGVAVSAGSVGVVIRSGIVVGTGVAGTVVVGNVVVAAVVVGAVDVGTAVVGTVVARSVVVTAVVVGAVAVGTVVVGSVVVGTAVVVGAAVVGTVVVAVVGSAVTVTVDVSVGAVDIGGGTTRPESGTPGMSWIERLAVAEKLAPSEPAVALGGEGSGVVGGVDSVAVAGPEPGSAGSAAGGAVPGSAAASASPETSTGTESSLEASKAVPPSAAAVSLREPPPSRVCTVGSPEYARESFTRTGGPESARTTSVIPIAVVTNAATTPARESRRRNRSAGGSAGGRPNHCGIRVRGSPAGFSLLSTVRIPLSLSSSGCAGRRKTVTASAPPQNAPENRTSNCGSSANNSNGHPYVNVLPRRAAPGQRATGLHCKVWAPNIPAPRISVDVDEAS